MDGQVMCGCQGVLSVLCSMFASLVWLHGCTGLFLVYDIPILMDQVPFSMQIVYSSGFPSSTIPQEFKNNELKAHHVI